jgi:hypothetical protein
MNLGWAAFVVVAASAVAVGALLLIRRWSHHGGHFGDTSRAVGVFTLLATSFAVLFAFVIFLAFSAYDRTRTGAETEANTVSQQFETAQFFPADPAKQLSGELVCYARTVVDQEWPEMTNGNPPAINPWGVRMFLTLKQVDPATPSQQAAYAKWLDQTSAREIARQDRLHGSSGLIPAPLWFVLLISSGIVLAFVFFFADRGEGAVVQGVQVAAVMAMLTASLLVVHFLDNPYSPGSGSIQPDAMEATISQLQLVTDRLNIPVADLCDEVGEATPVPSGG